MDAERFRNSPVGELVRVEFTDHTLGRTVQTWGFRPAPLPAEPAISLKTHKALAEAERELGRLDAQVQSLPNPRLLVRPAIQQEATSTSALEGTYAPFSEVLAADHIDDRRKSAELKEIQNYTDAAFIGLDLIKKKPICFSVAAELQRHLVRGTRGDAFDSGQMRKRIVAIGDQSGDIAKARFVPAPPGDQLQRDVDDWEKWIHAEDDVPFIARLALGHYQFETLHPFSDGNGRIGRLLIALQLVEADVLHNPVMNLSSWLEPRRQEYIDHLLHVSETGDYDSWINFFALGVRAQAAASSRRVARLTAVQESLVKRVLSVNKKGVIVEVTRDLIGYPFLSVKDVQVKYGISQPSARQIVMSLQSLGILRELTGGSYSRLYICDQVYEALAVDTSPLSGGRA